MLADGREERESSTVNVQAQRNPDLYIAHVCIYSAYLGINSYWTCDDSSLYYRYRKSSGYSRKKESHKSVCGSYK